MNRTHRLRLLVLGTALAWPLPAFAIFGVGDIVYDPASVEQTINVLHAAQQQIDRLGSILGVSTQQFDQLVSLTTAMGNGSEAAAFVPSLSSTQLQALVQSIPGLANANLQALFDTTGRLDAFLGVPVQQWSLAVENPTAFYSTILMNPAIARTGAAAGLPSPAIAYLQWYTALSAEDQANLGGRAAADLANLLTGDWLQEGKQRRVNLQGLAAASQAAQTKAGQAQTLADQQQAQAQLNASTNQILLESAVQDVNARETAIRAAGAQKRILQEQDEARRDALALRLDAPQ